MRYFPTIAVAALAAGLLSAAPTSTPAWAQAIDLDTPEVTKGEHEVRSVNVVNRGWAAPVDGAPLVVHEVSAAYSPLDWLRGTIHLDVEQIRDEGWRVDHFGLEALALLKRDDGESGLAVAWFTSVQVSTDQGSTNSVIIGPVVRMTAGAASIVTNTYIEQTFGRNSTPGANLLYGWHAKYELRKGLAFGLEGIGKIADFGSLPNLASQDHRIGPALFLEWELDRGRAWAVDSAVLLGTTPSSSDVTIKVDFGTTY